MSTTFRANGGESWSDVARQTTGSDLDASLIRRANPGLTAPLSNGDIVQLPGGVATDAEIGTEELEIRVNGTRIDTVDDFELHAAVDAFAKGGFSVPNVEEMRDLFEPLTFPRITVDSLGERLFTGRAWTPGLDEQKRQEVTIWADPVILETSSPPIEAFPLEWRNATLKLIAGDLANLFGIKLDYQAPEKVRFKRVDIEPGDYILGFLQNLATQRGLILSDDALGGLVISNGTGGEIVSYLEQGKHPTEYLQFQIDDNAYYSHVSVTIPAKGKRKRGGKRHTIRNPYLVPGIKRPYNYEAKDIDEGELEQAANSIAGRAFSELVKGSANKSTWTTDSGVMYRPGQHVMAKSEEYRVPNPFEFLVSSVSYRKTSAAKTVDMDLVMPGVFSGEIPKRLPWQK